MLALEYGYRVGSDCALAADGTNAAAMASGEHDKAAIAKMLKWNGAAFAALVVSLGLAYFVSVRFAPLIVVAVLAWCVVFIADAVRARRGPSISKLIAHPLAFEPWQAWPCRVEDVGRPSSGMHLVYLMSPDQQVVRAFKTRMPERVRTIMAHGMGVLWVCGEIDHPRVALGSVKGEIVWAAHRASRRAELNGPQPMAAFDRCIEEASSAAMDNLLNL